jgi:hypothetical protein
MAAICFISGAPHGAEYQIGIGARACRRLTLVFR